MPVTGGRMFLPDGSTCEQDRHCFEFVVYFVFAIFVLSILSPFFSLTSSVELLSSLSLSSLYSSSLERFSSPFLRSCTSLNFSTLFSLRLNFLEHDVNMCFLRFEQS